MPAPKLELKSLLTKNCLPGNGNPLERGAGTPFTFYWCRDSHEMYFTDANGNFVNLGSLLASAINGSTPVAFPATGCAGADGAQGPKGDRGPQGPAGRDGSNGKDSTVPGPQGRDGDRGPQGPAGRDGRDGKDGKDSTVPGPIGATGPQGIPGPKGEIHIPNESELAAAVIALRQKSARSQAHILQAIADSEHLPASTRIHVLSVLKRVQKELQ